MLERRGEIGSRSDEIFLVGGLLSFGNLLPCMGGFVGILGLSIVKDTGLR
jgi:hypothetical protein